MHDAERRAVRLAMFWWLGLCLSSAGWSQALKIVYPPDKSTTALEILSVTITVPPGTTEARVEVFGKKNTPVYSQVWRMLNAASTTKKVLLAPGVENTITVSLVSDPTKCFSITVTQEGDESDTRGNWEASGYAGASIDSFAANETKNYLGYNQPDTAGGKNLQQASGPQTGYVAGVNFAYRMFKASSSPQFPVQLWVYGETVHGERSTEVDCNSAPDTCKLFDPTGFDVSKLGSTFFAILRNSSSLEGYAGARLEFMKLNPGSADSANLYIKSQLGFITVQNNGGDIVDDHIKVAIGAIMTNGLFKHSYLEAGYGKSDLFAMHRGRRFKVDGYLEWQLPGTNRFSRAISPFLQLSVEAILDQGPTMFARITV